MAQVLSVIVTRPSRFALGSGYARLGQKYVALGVAIHLVH